MTNPQPLALGLDFGTNTVRALIIHTQNGTETANTQTPYPHGTITDPNQPKLARQHPNDYLQAATHAIHNALQKTKTNHPQPHQIIGIGIAATGSTPLPTDQHGNPLTQQPQHQNNPNAHAWLWKDHTAHKAAQQLTQHTQNHNPQYLQHTGGTYSPEWFWAKLLHCAQTDPNLIQQTHTWIEIADWIPATLTGNAHNPKRGICQASHKASYHHNWGGYPSHNHLQQINPHLARIRKTLPNKTHTHDQPAGTLTPKWANKLHLKPGTPVAIGALDAHLAALGAGIQPGTLIKIIGTSTCDILITPLTPNPPTIPGISGILPHTVLPNHLGIEAGQTAVGDLLNWWTQTIQPGNNHTHQHLTQLAQQQQPGQTGLLALDWNNGNRNILADPQLTGLLIGQTLHTQPHQIYQALIEATAYGARTIIEHIQKHNIPIRHIIATGGIPHKNPHLLQTYANITNRPITTTHATQTSALGAALCAAVAARIHPDLPTAQKHMTPPTKQTHQPQPNHTHTYNQLYQLYQQLHNNFGKPNTQTNLHHTMKTLNQIRQQTLQNNHNQPKPKPTKT